MVKAPPLTRVTGKWQVTPDGSDDAFAIPAGQEISIPLASKIGTLQLCSPAVPSPFVAAQVGNNADRSGSLQLFDLRTAKLCGAIGIDKPRKAHSLSPDGLHFAETTDSGKINLWSFKKGKVIREIDLKYTPLPAPYLPFASSDRLLVLLPVGGPLLTLDVKTGKQIAVIEKKCHVDANKIAISPGGNYVALSKVRTIEIYDTRNGLIAGEIKHGSNMDVRPADALSFSHDGSELAAFLGRFKAEKFIHWDMTNREVIAEFEVPDLPSTSLGVPPIEWFHDKSAWWICSQAVLDRKSQKLIYTWKRDGKSPLILDRRYIDNDRMLGVTVQQSETNVLKILPIDKEALTSGAEAIAGGGTSADVGLPTLTATEMPATIEAVQAVDKWTYKATAAPLPASLDLSKPLTLSQPPYYYDMIYFSAPTAARVFIGLRKTPESFLLYELGKRAPTAQFKIPIASTCIGLGPNGKLGLFRTASKKDRHDIYDLIENKHLLAFRPYGPQDEIKRQVTWGALAADGNVALTVNYTGQLVAWSLPECKAKWSMEIGDSTPPALDASRTTLAVPSVGGFHLVDVATGEVRGTLERNTEIPDAALYQLAFRGGGKALAAMYKEKDRTILCSWNLEDGHLQRELRLACPAMSMAWAGPDQVVLHRTSAATQGDPVLKALSHKIYQCSVVDLKRGFLTWTYQHPEGHYVEQNFADRHWSMVSSALGQAGHLLGLKLPDSEELDLIDKAKPPQSLLEAGGRVGLAVEISGNLPASSNDQQTFAVRMRDEVNEKMAESLTAQNLTRDDQSPVRLRVTMRERERSTALSVSPRFRPFESQIVLLKTTEIEIGIGLQVGGTIVWQQGQYVTLEDLEPNQSTVKIPVGSEAKEYFRQKMWEIAVKKVTKTVLPLPIYPSNFAEGLGESDIFPSGPKATRKPLPSQDKRT